MMECLIWSIGIVEYWNHGLMDKYFTLREVGGASACSGLEAEGQQSFASCLMSFVPQDKLSDPEPKVMLFRFWYPIFRHSNIPSAHYSNWYPGWDVPAGAKLPRSYMINELQKYLLQNSLNSGLWMLWEISGRQNISSSKISLEPQCCSNKWP